MRRLKCAGCVNCCGVYHVTAYIPLCTVMSSCRHPGRAAGTLAALQLYSSSLSVVPPRRLPHRNMSHDARHISVEAIVGLYASKRVPASHSVKRTSSAELCTLGGQVVYCPDQLLLSFCTPSFMNTSIPIVASALSISPAMSQREIKGQIAAPMIRRHRRHPHPS